MLFYTGDLFLQIKFSIKHKNEIELDYILNPYDFIGS